MSLTVHEWCGQEGAGERDFWVSGSEVHSVTVRTKWNNVCVASGRGLISIFSSLFSFIPGTITYPVTEARNVGVILVPLSFTLMSSPPELMSLSKGVGNPGSETFCVGLVVCLWPEFYVLEEQANRGALVQGVLQFVPLRTCWDECWVSCGPTCTPPAPPHLPSFSSLVPQLHSGTSKCQALG